MKIIHLSDLHFHSHDKDNEEIIETLKYVKNNYKNHYIVVTGDIVDDGHEKQYDNAYEVLKEFEGRIFISPGNHDFGAVGAFYSLERAKRFDEKLSIPLKQDGTFSEENTPVVNVVQENNDQIMFIALDTNIETEHPFDFACGKVGEKQLGSLNTILTNPTVPEMKKIVFFHHHPFMHNDPFMELKDATELARIVYNKVDLILFGHKHVMGEWKNWWGTKSILASDNSPGKNKAAEITIQKGIIKADYIDIC